MRFLADESCDFAVVRALREAGHDVAALAELDAGAEDAAVIARALGEQRVLLTEDKDFGQLVFASGRPAAGVVFRLNLMPEPLSEPLERRKPTVYFVNSMSDLFHEKVPFGYIGRVFDVMGRAPHHTFQVLTKRAERMVEFCRGVTVPSNVWLGVSVENRKYGLPRIPVLRRVNAEVRFLSIEPLLEDLGRFDLTGVQWVIVGGESGHKATPMKPEWVDGIKRQCDAAGVAFFFKQWGAWGADGEKRSKSANGREYRGRVWDAMPQLA